MDRSYLLSLNLILMNQISVWSTLLSQEVTANYGFMEKYLATEAGIQMMLTVDYKLTYYKPVFTI